jgi:hypothetical protein
VIALLRELLTGTYGRLRGSKVSIGLWILVILSAVAFPVQQTLTDKYWADDSAPFPATALIVAMIAICWLTLHISWKLTRSFADYTDRPGAVWPWLGWSFLTYVPTIAVVIGLYAANDAEGFFYPEAFAFAFLPAITAPLLVHATGRAIDATGPRVGGVMTFWARHYAPLVATYLLVTAPPTLLSEVLYIFSANENILIDVAASLIYLPAMILGTALTVEAFHRTPQKSPA